MNNITSICAKIYSSDFFSADMFQCKYQQFVVGEESVILEYSPYFLLVFRITETLSNICFLFL